MGKNSFLIILIIVVAIAIVGIFVVYIATVNRTPNSVDKNGGNRTVAPPVDTTSVKPPIKEVTPATPVTPTEKTAVNPAIKEKPVTGKPEKFSFEYVYTGFFIRPKKIKSAFIRNTITNTEQLYQEGEFLHSVGQGKWTIYKIDAAKTTLYQYYPDGSVAKEYTMKLTEIPDGSKPLKPDEADSAIAYKNGEMKIDEPKTAENINLSSPTDLDKAMQDTSFDDMMGLISNVPESLIQAVLNKIPEEYLKQKLEECSLGSAITEETYKDKKPAEIVNILKEVAMDYSTKGEPVLLFATDVNPDNSPISATKVFPSGIKKIFTSFANQGSLEKLDTVIIKWVNASTSKIVHWGAYKLNAMTAYNYIFLSMEAGKWTPGRYIVTIYKRIQDNTPAAYGEFEVK